MPKEKIKYGIPYKAREMFAVLIEKQRASRSYSKKEALEDLKLPEMQTEFLKVCMEFDGSDDLKIFRKGLLLILREIGISEAAKATKIPRTTIYRMLWKDGNPNLKYLTAILNYLGMNLWVVSHEFIKAEPSKRFKDEPGQFAQVMDTTIKRRNKPKNWY
jgi:DNA-binding phage protein